MSKMNNPFYNHDIFPEICKHLKIKHLIKLERLSKYHKNIIREHPWNQFIITIVNRNVYVLNMYNFMQINIWMDVNMTVDVTKILNRCHTLNLSFTNVTDECLKNLKNCRELNLVGCDYVTDIGVKELKHCHILHISNYIHITDECIKELRCCGVKVFLH